MDRGKVIAGLAAFLQFAVALTIICIISFNLSEVWVSGWSVEYNCLWHTNGSDAVCNYGYTVAGVSMAASALLGLLQCLTLNLCGLGGVLDVALGIFGVIWWVAAAITFTAYNDQDLPNQNWRTAVTVLAWVQVALFSIMCVGGLGSLFHTIFKKRKHSSDPEPGKPTVVVVQQAPMAPPPPQPTVTVINTPAAHAPYPAAPAPAYVEQGYSQQPQPQYEYPPQQQPQYQYPTAPAPYPPQPQPYPPQAPPPPQGGSYPSIPYQ